MKYKLLRLSLLSMLAMFFGGLGSTASAADKWVKTAATDLATGDVVVIVDQTSATAMSNDKGTSSAPAATAVTLSGDQSELDGEVAENLQWVVTVADGSYQFNVAGTEDYVYCTNTNNGVRVGTNENNAFTITQGGDNNADFLVNTATSRYIGVYNSQDWRCYTSINANIKATVTAFYKKTESGQEDNRAATTLTLGDYQTTGVVGESMNLPTVTVATADGAPVENAEIEWTSSNTDVAAITDGVISFNATGTTTIKASFAGDDNYKASSASFTLTVTAAPYTSIAAMLADITSTRTTATYQFENLLVTYVNGQNTFVSDGRNGFLFYDSDKSNLGLKAGDIITGTATGQLYTFNGLPEMSLSANGISAEVVSEGNNVAWSTIPAADLQSYVNIPVTIEDAVYVEASGKNLTFKVGEETLSVYNNWSIDITALEADKTYTLTGVGSVYSRNETTTYQLYLVSFEEKGEEPEPVWAWADITADFTNGSFFADGESGTYGLKMNEDGSFTRVDADDVTANAIITGKFHSNEHGLQNFSAQVKVEGPVKISFGTCAWGGNVTVKDETGAEVVPTFTTNTGACYHNNKTDNIVSAYYKGEATTLTIAGGAYVPYFAVVAVDPADIPNDAKVTFEIAGVDCEGVAPAEITAEISSTITIPANRTLYRDGSTLTAWTDSEGNLYKAGDEITVNADLTLTPVFTENEETGEITEPTTVIWDFQQKNGAPVLNYQNKTGIYVAQRTINGITSDVKLDFDTNNGGKIANGSWQDWCQMNGGTKLTIPAANGMTVSIESYSVTTTTTIAGSTDYTAEGNVVTYTHEGTNEFIDIVIGDGSYFRYVKAVYPVPAEEIPSSWVDIKADFTNGSFFTSEETSVTTAGLKMNEDGTFTRVAADDETANAIITGKYHSNEHGLANFSATVKVEGPVKVSMGTCAWGGDVTVKNAEGETVATFNTNTGACYHNDKENNIASTFYKGEATTLTISGGSYTPYFAVEAVDVADIPSDCKITFDVATSGAEGVAPAAETVEIGADYRMPINFTLYKEGYTLTGWTNGETTWAPGESLAVPEVSELNLTPVFTENEVSLADRTEAVTLKFNFRRDAGAPTVAFQNQTGIWVAQANINGTDIDVKADFDTNNGGKFANGNWNDWAQLNGGTKWTVPSCKGATVSMEAYSEITTTTIDGQTDYTSGKTISYTIASAAETVDVVIGDGSYYRYIQVVLPVVEQQQGGGESFDNEVATIVWPFNNPNDIAAYTATPAEAFVTVAANTGDIELTGTGTGQAKYPDGSTVTFAKLKPSGSTQAVEWAVKPAAGLTFTPTKVSAYIARFGTDAQNGITITAKAGDGETITLGNFTAPRNNKSQADDKYGSNSNYTNQFVIELTEEQQAALTSADGLSVFGTVGVGSGKEGGYAEMTIEGLVNGTKADVALYTLAVAASPEEAGSINVYPAADQYEEGSEVTLTATENFGYDFVNWTNAAGEEVSTEAKFKYTVNSDETLTANFKQVETYELALTVDGTNDYMVTISPAPTVVDGKNMYEAGQAVQLTANQYEGLVTFTNWSDGDTNSNKLVSMSEDIQLTAYYAEADIIAGWDFYKAGSSGRKADFAAQDNDGDALNLVNTESGETSGWLDKSTLGGGGYESFAGAAVNWRTGTKNGDVGNWHWQTKVNAAAFQDINVQFQMLYNYNAYQTYDVEYSLDGEEWTKFGSITMTGTKAAASFSEQLPAAANNQAELYIRMLADKTSNVDGASSANDGNTLTMFFITGTPQLIDDGTAPVLVSTVPADGAEGASASGKIVLTFDERVKVADYYCCPGKTAASLVASFLALQMLSRENDPLGRRKLAAEGTHEWSTVSGEREWHGFGH